MRIRFGAGGICGSDMHYFRHARTGDFVVKDMIKRVAEGDRMIRVNLPYPPAMIATAMELTAANFYDQTPIRGNCILDATLVTTENANEFHDPDSPF